MANIDNSHQVRMEIFTALHEEYDHQRNQLGHEHLKAQVFAIIHLTGLFPGNDFVECCAAFLSTDW